jgi:rubredoxin
MTAVTCPSCGVTSNLEPYNIGSGPEYSCPNCEWCWGAEGQNLQPLPRLIRAPFTPSQVKALNDYQHSGLMHPFTCRNRGDGSHRPRKGEDLGELVATEAGWVCQDCDYTQDWAHGFMLQVGQQ